MCCSLHLPRLCPSRCSSTTPALAIAPRRQDPRSSRTRMAGAEPGSDARARPSGTSARGRDRNRGAIVAVRGAQPAARAADAALEPALRVRRTATTRPVLVALLLLLSHLIVAMPARSFLHSDANGRAAGRSACSRHAGDCPGKAGGARWRHGGSCALGELHVLRLRGGVDNTRYYEVLKLPVGEEDENVSDLPLPAVPRSCACLWPCANACPKARFNGRPTAKRPHMLPCLAFVAACTLRRSPVRACRRASPLQNRRPRNERRALTATHARMHARTHARMRTRAHLGYRR